MIDDNTRRIQIPDGEVRELTSPDGLLWERAVSEIKGRLEAAYVTRDNGIQHLKAFGATPMKHKQDKLWGRYVPAKATDETLYPMVLTGYGTLVANGTEDYTSPTISEGKLYRNTATAGIADNSKFSYCSRTYLPATQTTRFNHSQYFTSTSSYCDFIDNDYSSVASFKAALAANPVTILYAKATSDGSVWKFVKDIGLDGTGSDFGYYNEATGEFVKAQGASGELIQPISSISGVTPSANEMTVRAGTNGFLLNTETWTLTSASGTLGSDIPYAQLCPDIIKVNTGDLKYGQYGNKYGIFTDGTHKVKLSKDGTQIAERNIPMLLSEDSFVDIQTGNKSEAWAVKVLNGTESYSKRNDASINYTGLSGRKYGSSAPRALCTHFNCINSSAQKADIGTLLLNISNTFTHFFTEFGDDIDAFKSWLASEYAAGHPVIVLYPLVTPATEQVTIAPIASARRTTYVADSESELGKLNLELKFLGK